MKLMFGVRPSPAILNSGISYFSPPIQVLFRALCDGSCTWDDPLEGDAVSQWLRIVDEISSLGVIRLPHCYFLPNVYPSFTEIQGFCDASLQAYAAVLYMHSVYPDGSVKVEIQSRCCESSEL